MRGSASHNEQVYEQNQNKENGASKAEDEVFPKVQSQKLGMTPDQTSIEPSQVDPEVKSADTVVSNPVHEVERPSLMTKESLRPITPPADPPPATQTYASRRRSTISKYQAPDLPPLVEEPASIDDRSASSTKHDALEEAHASLSAKNLEKEVVESSSSDEEGVLVPRSNAMDNFITIGK